jgi:hypothetical protein
MAQSDGIRVNFSGKEAKAEGQSVKVLPRGEYHVKVTDGSLEEVKDDSKGNQGKPYYKLELTVQSGEFTGRRLTASAMLFEGALYTISQIMKAMGLETEGDTIIPPLADIIGRDFIVGVTVRKANDDYDESNNVRSFMPVTDVTAKAASKTGKANDRKAALRP